MARPANEIPVTALFARGPGEKRIQSILDRAVEKRVKQTTKSSKTKHIRLPGGSGKKAQRSLLSGALTRALTLRGVQTTSAKPSIRMSAPDTGGRSFHFAYYSVSKGGSHGAIPKSKDDPSTNAGAHLSYIERESAVEQRIEREGAGLGASIMSVEEARAVLDNPRARGRQSLAAIAARDGAQRVIDTNDLELGTDSPGRAGSAQAYIEQPAKMRNGELILSSFGNIGETHKDRLRFWKELEEHERMPNARIQNRIICELPHQSTPEARAKILKKFVEPFEDKGIRYHVAVHAPGKNNDARNFHAHIVFSERPAKMVTHPVTGQHVWDFTVIETVKDASKHVRKKHTQRQNRDPDLRKISAVKDMRQRYADIVTEVMKSIDAKVKFDARSYKDMGLDIDPMRSVNRVLHDLMRDGKLVIQDYAWTKRMMAAEIRAGAIRGDRDVARLFKTTKIMEAMKAAFPNLDQINKGLGPNSKLRTTGIFTKRTFAAVVDQRITLEHQRLQEMIAAKAEIEICRRVLEACRQVDLKGPGRKVVRTPEDDQALAFVRAAALDEQVAIRAKLKQEEERITRAFAQNRQAWKAATFQAPGTDINVLASAGGSSTRHSEVLPDVTRANSSMASDAPGPAATGVETKPRDNTHETQAGEAMVRLSDAREEVRPRYAQQFADHQQAAPAEMQKASPQSSGPETAKPSAAISASSGIPNQPAKSTLAQQIDMMMASFHDASLTPQQSAAKAMAFFDKNKASPGDRGYVDPETRIRTEQAGRDIPQETGEQRAAREVGLVPDRVPMSPAETFDASVKQSVSPRPPLAASRQAGRDIAQETGEQRAAREVGLVSDRVPMSPAEVLDASVNQRVRVTPAAAAPVLKTVEPHVPVSDRLPAPIALPDAGIDEDVISTSETLHDTHVAAVTPQPSWPDVLKVPTKVDELPAWPRDGFTTAPRPPSLQEPSDVGSLPRGPYEDMFAGAVPPARKVSPNADHQRDSGSVVDPAKISAAGRDGSETHPKAPVAAKAPQPSWPSGLQTSSEHAVTAATLRDGKTEVLSPHSLQGRSDAVSRPAGQPHDANAFASSPPVPRDMQQIQRTSVMRDFSDASALEELDAINDANRSSALPREASFDLRAARALLQHALDGKKRQPGHTSASDQNREKVISPAPEDKVGESEDAPPKVASLGNDEARLTNRKTRRRAIITNKKRPTPGGHGL